MAHADDVRIKALRQRAEEDDSEKVGVARFGRERRPGPGHYTDSDCHGANSGQYCDLAPPACWIAK